MTPPQQPAPRTLLPLTPVAGAGERPGGRSHMTCRYRCGNACDQPVPNQSGNPHIQDEIAKVVARRRLLQGAAAVAGASALGGLVATPGTAAAATRGTAAAAAARTTGDLATTTFRPVAPNKRDAVVTAAGFTHDVVIRWGDPLVPGAPRFDAFKQTPEAARQQFGYNCDYIGMVAKKGKANEDTALLVVNHEYTDEALMFPAETYTDDEIKRISMTSHGMSVVTLKRGLAPGSWRRVKNLGRAPQNRRLHIETPFRLDGPAAGDERLRTSADPSGRTVLGTLNNCSGGMTPWGTVLSGEENFNQYFEGALDERYAAEYARYGITGQPGRGWRTVDPRFDLAEEPHEPHRFGWVVEVDPTRPRSTPRKHTMLGRIKHEGANIVIARNGRAVAYMGDDERGDYLYKFVSAGTYDPRPGSAARKNNLALLERGTLYVGRLTGDGLEDGVSDGSGEWVPLCSDEESFVEGRSVADVLLFTRLAADQVTATRMDRPEDVEPNLVNGKIYAALTNNSERGSTYPVDEPNPRGASMVRSGPGEPLTPASGNRNGYVLEMTPRRGDHTATAFTWDLMLICGDPEDPSTYFAGMDKSQVSPISCPDNVTFDTVGNLWVATDGNALGSNDGIFRVPTAGPDRGKVRQFVTMPIGAEACGPLIADQNKSLFFAAQHPGEVDGATFEDPASTWPHTDDFPRPSVCVAYKAR